MIGLKIKVTASISDNSGHFLSFVLDQFFKLNPNGDGVKVNVTASKMYDFGHYI